MRERIGFIGLGIMGRPMARNLLAAAYPLTVWNRSRPGIDALVAQGAGEGAGPKDVADRCDVVITMVSDSPDVESIALGPGGIIEAGRPELAFVDMSTISPAVTRRIAVRLAGAGVEMLDAPVSGGETGAINATLSIMVGGPEAAFQRWRPIFEAMGRTIVYCGPSGAGQAVKLCNQIAGGLNNLAMCEALLFAAKMGVDPHKMLEAVGAGAATSWAIQNLAPKVLARDFRPGFKVAHQQKDLRLVLEAAEEHHLPLPGTGLVHQLFAAVEAEGLGGEGVQALAKALEKLASVQVS